MGLPTTELCIGLTPITIGIDEKSRLVKEDGESTRKMKIEEFVKCLEEERSKIDAFRRELPLCFHIVKQVIDDMKEELTKSGSRVGNNNHPILEQFLPTKSMFEEKRIVLEKDNKDNKMDWMDSAHAQLWKSEIYSNKCGGNFDNLRLYRGISGISKEPEIEEKKMVSLPDLSLVTPGINSSDTSTRSLPPKEHCFYASNTKDDPLGSLSSSLNPSKRLHGQQQQHQQNTSRKARRSWSPDLHEKFVTVLDQLGGSHVATPKQIRETMKVDGLTNDEVKSHLQKYRLHVQRVHLYSSSRIEPVSYYDEGLTRHSPPFSRST